MVTSEGKEKGLPGSRSPNSRRPEGKHRYSLGGELRATPHSSHKKSPRKRAFLFRPFNVLPRTLLATFVAVSNTGHHKALHIHTSILMNLSEKSEFTL